MAVFKNEPEEWQRLDWMILQNGWISLYSKHEFLLIDIGWFRKERYRVIELDCSSWIDDTVMHADLKLKFRFSENYGSNLNAFRNNLSNVSIVGAGMVVVLHHFDKLEKKLGQSLLDILAESARLHMLLGERIITLVQVDDANAALDSVGAIPIAWNPHEWLKLTNARK